MKIAATREPGTGVPGNYLCMHTPGTCSPGYLFSPGVPCLWGPEWVIGLCENASVDALNNIINPGGNHLPVSVEFTFLSPPLQK